MTDGEKDVIYLLNDVYDRYCELPVQHRDDMKEFVNALHVLQHLVMIRDVRRNNNDMFPMVASADATVSSMDGMKPALEKAVSEQIGELLKGGGLG